MVAESNRLANMVGELIELSRLQGAERLPDLEVVDVDAVVAEALSRHKVAADNADIAVTTDAPTGSGAGRPDPAGDRLANLVDNAIAYSPNGSPVSVSRRRRGDNIEIAVTDRGIGIAARGPGAGVRAVLPRRQGAIPGDRRHRAGPGDRQARRRQPQRLHPAVESAGYRVDLHACRFPAYSDGAPIRDAMIRRTRGLSLTSMTSVLIVEDEESLADPLAFLLRKEGFEATVVADGPSALAEFERSGADIVLLDLMLPGMSGTDVCKQLRSRSSVPVIMVTARDSEIDKVVGLELGADDYVTKPYSARELIARIRAVLRRGAERRRHRHRRRGAGGRPGADGRRAARGQRQRDPITLPLKEFDLLEYLMRNSGRVLTRGQLIDRVWGADYVGDTKTLDVHVKRLRSQDRGGSGQPGASGHRARPGLQAGGLSLQAISAWWVAKLRPGTPKSRPAHSAARVAGWIAISPKPLRRLHIAASSAYAFSPSSSVSSGA